MADRDQLKNGNWICVLSDGETYTGLGGSYIAILTAEQDKELNEGTEPNQLDNLQQHELNKLLDWAIDNGYFDQGAANVRFGGNSGWCLNLPCEVV